MSTDDQHLASSERPWIGLTSFIEADSEFFAGRGEESDGLLRLVHRDTLTLLYGVSGIGKTSLLQAGLFPALRADDFLPIPIRPDYLDDSLPLVMQVHRAIAKAAAAAGVEQPEPRAEETLWEYFHRIGHDFWSRRNEPVTPVLVFDQFEEIFTLGRETAERARRAEAFLTELAELVENRAPTALRANPQRATGFDFKPIRLKVLLAMREDYLADLDRLRSRFRDLGQNRLRLLPMGEGQARAVIELGAPLFAPGIPERILAFVAGSQAAAAEEDITIAPALLSLVLRELNERRLARGADAKITADLLDLEQTKILEGFYLRSLKGCPAGARAFIEDALLTAGGYRNSCALDDALAREGVTQTVIDTLVNRRLLSYEDRHRSRRVELSHDVLVPIVKASRDARRTLEKLKAERKGRRHRWREIFGMIGLGAALLLGSLTVVAAIFAVVTLAFLAAGYNEETINTFTETYGVGLVATIVLFIVPVTAVVAWLRARKRADNALRACERAEETRRKTEVLISVVDFELRTKFDSPAEPQATQSMLERIQEARGILAAGTVPPALAASTPRTLGFPEAAGSGKLWKKWAIPLLLTAFATMTFVADNYSSRSDKNLKKRQHAEEVLAVYQQKIDEATKALQQEPDAEIVRDSETDRRLLLAGALVDSKVLHFRMGFALESQNKLKEALEPYQRALEIAERVSADLPDARGNQYDLVILRTNVGRVMKQLGQNGESLTQRGRELTQRLEAIDTPPETQRLLKEHLKRLSGLKID